MKKSKLKLIIKECILEIIENKVKWVFPSDAKLKEEYDREYKKKYVRDIIGDVFPTEDDFIRVAKASETKEITPQEDKNITYRSRTQDRDELISLVSGYRSWPKFRNEETVDHLYDVMKNGGEMDMPIVLKRGDWMRVFSGNTRMDVAFQLGINPMVVMMEI